MRYGGARGQLTVLAGSGFYTHAVAAVCRRIDVRFSITIRQHNLIEAIPEADWTPIPYWMDGAADVAETTYRAWLRSLNPNVRRNIICYILTVTITDHSVSGLSRAEASYIVTHLDFWDALYTPFRTEPGAAPVRLIVPRVKPTPGSQLALFATYSYHGFITVRDGEMLELEADHRRHAEIENAIRDLKYGVGLNHLPSGRFAANGSWLAVQVMAHNLARWTAAARPG